MTIRPALPADAGAIHDLAQRAYGGYVERIGARPWPMDVDYAEAIERADVSIFEEGQVVGYVVLIPKPDHLLVENIAVDPSHQSKGIGRALLAHAEGRARSDDLKAMRLDTNAAMTENLAFYPRLGYREIERRGERVCFLKLLN